MMELPELAGKRAENYYVAHRLCCSEAVLLVLNQAFNGGLPPATAVSLGSGFCGGMGGAGSTCGALSGAEMALGIYLGPTQKGGVGNRAFRRLSKELHDRFGERFGSTSCRALTAHFSSGRKGQRQNCRVITGFGAQLATTILLEQRPKLGKRADIQFLIDSDSRFIALFKKIMAKVTP